MSNLNKILTQVPTDIFFDELSKAILATAKNNLAATGGNTFVNPAVYTNDKINQEITDNCPNVKHPQTRKPSIR